MTSDMAEWSVRALLRLLRWKYVRPERMMLNGFLKTAAMALGVMLLTLCAAVSMFLNAATDGELYYEIQTEHNVQPGVDSETMHELDMLLARYLAGDEAALDETELFNADEKAHMEDVYDIFAALRTIKIATLVGGVLTLALVYYNRTKFSRRQLQSGAVLGAALFFLPITAIAAWAALDFAAAFTWMHHVLFSNDLWLMDAATDLMIRMLPEVFFVDIGIKLAVRAILGALAAAGVVFLCTIDWEKNTGKKHTDK